MEFSAAIPVLTSTTSLAPTVSLKSTFSGVDTSNSTDSTSSENPGAVTCTSYVPGCTCENVYSPLDLVAVVSVVPVAGFLMLTVTLCTTAPVESVTTPLNPVVLVCANAAEPASNNVPASAAEDPRPRERETRNQERVLLPICMENDLRSKAKKTVPAQQRDDSHAVFSMRRSLWNAVRLESDDR